MSSTQRIAPSQAPVETPQTETLRRRRYGEDRLYLLVRDPRSLCAAWEICDRTAHRAEESARRSGAPIRYQLRIERRASEEAKGVTIRVVDLPDAVGGDGWYVDLPESGGRCRARIGLDLPEGFEALVESRWVLVPPDHPCAEVGEWVVDPESGRQLDRYFASVSAVPGSPGPRGGPEPAEPAGRPPQRGTIG